MTALLFCALSGMLAYAEDKTFTITVDNTELIPGERTRMEMLFKGVEELPSPKEPVSSGLEFRYRGLVRGLDTSGGNMLETITFKYDIKALQPGTHSIGPLEVQYNGDVYRSNEVVIEVGSGEVSSSGAKKEKGALEGHIFMKVDIPEKAYINQKIPIKVRFFTDWLDIEGLKLYEAPNKRYVNRDYVQGKTTLAVRGSVRYAVIVFEKWIFVPEAGEMEFGPVFASAEIVKPKAELLNPNRDFYEAYIGRGGSRSFTDEIGPFTVNILPLPSKGRPDTFRGAVGTFQMETAIDKSEGIKPGDIVTVTFTITGKGNFLTVSSPIVASTDGVEIKEPVIERSAESVIIIQPLEIKETHLDKLPDITFSFFDPALSDYTSIVENDLAIKMVKPVGGEKAISKELEEKVPDLKRSEQKVPVKPDILYIKNSPGSLVYGDPFSYSDRILAAAIVFPLFLMLLSVVIEKRMRLLREDTDYACWLLGLKVSKEGLPRAKRLSGGKDPYAFYTYVFQFIQNYLAKRLNLEPGGLTAEIAILNLSREVVDDDICGKIRNIFKDSYIARYAPEELKNIDMKKTYKDLKDLISFLDGKRKI